MHFKPYKPEYLATCLEIYDSNCPKYFAPEERPEFIEWLEKDHPSSPYWVQEVDGEIIGCGGIYTSLDHQKDSIYGGEVGFAWGMVHNNVHKEGHGKALFLHRLNYLKNNYPGVPTIIRTSQYTYTFFAKYGFETLEYTENGWEQGLHKHEMIYRDPAQAKVETERFRLRQFEKHDGQHLFQLNSNPNVMKYIPLEPFTSVEEGEKDVELKLGHYRDHGIGRWLVIDKLTGDCIGWCGMSWLEDRQVMDIGFIADAYVGNEASIRVMKKLGMTFAGHDEYQGYATVVYESIKEELAI